MLRAKSCSETTKAARLIIGLISRFLSSLKKFPEKGHVSSVKTFPGVEYSRHLNSIITLRPSPFGISVSTLIFPTIFFFFFRLKDFLDVAQGAMHHAIGV